MLICRGKKSRGNLVQQTAGDDLTLNLVGALEDLEELGVTHELFEGGLPAVKAEMPLPARSEAPKVTLQPAS